MTFKHSSAPGLSNFWVVCPVSNPARFARRYELHRRFVESMKRAGVNLLVVEAAFGDRPFEVTEAGNPNHVQLRTREEIWHKENMINVAMGWLPSDWQYVAWIDGDIDFVRGDWAEETVHQLQHHAFVQMFQTAIDLGPAGEAMTTFDGFAASYVTKAAPPYAKQGYPHWHPGFAWAARRDAIENVGGLIDVGVLGASDHHMAWALVGEVLEHTPGNVTDSYKRHLTTWQERARVHVAQNVGYVPGTIVHHWHGKKRDRKYQERWDILFRHNFDPDRDLKRDSQGLYALTHEGARLRSDLREYFRQRNEDSIDP